MSLLITFSTVKLSEHVRMYLQDHLSPSITAGAILGILVKESGQKDLAFTSSGAILL